MQYIFFLASKQIEHHEVLLFGQKNTSFMKSFKTLLRQKIYAHDTDQVLGRVRQLLIDPYNGKVRLIILSFLPPESLYPEDVFIFKSKLMVSSANDVFSCFEVEKIRQDLPRLEPIIASEVYTESGDFLGLVSDFFLDENLLKLRKIKVTKKFFRIFPYNKALIDAKDILRIEKHKILVKDALVKVKRSALVMEGA
jgi:sporulation protein YlmC with PRC-barrel domain